MSVFKDVAHNFIYDGVGLSETDLETGLETVYTLPNYNKYYRFRNTMGGGTLFYNHRRLSSRLVEEISCVAQAAEIVFAKCSVGNYKFIFDNYKHH